ncbi:MAG: carboxypeptidase regulatory-like domain-containing protein, partial [Phaeodactylibacter sp.]|nr:carboxypeptidase regulatory-like domain-containing protein [Phaeodactylibacter sp.]
MRIFITLSLTILSCSLLAQTAGIRGQLQDADGAAVIFANVGLYHAADSTLAKVETSDESGVFQMKGLAPGTYFLSATYVGAQDLKVDDLQLKANQDLDLGVLAFRSAAIELETATVTAERVMVEVKPDRTVFNVDGTINSTGSDAMNLLRKAPGVLVDNNNNLVVLGRTGVLVYLDGKRLPISGDDLASFLGNIPADQIDRIDIITNPGAKYEAEGNAGIIDIRLKKDKNLGGNGSLNTSFSQGRHPRFNVGGTGNYRNKYMNVFGNAGFFDGESFNDMLFVSLQNGLFMDEY